MLSTVKHSRRMRIIHASRLIMQKFNGLLRGRFERLGILFRARQSYLKR